MEHGGRVQRNHDTYIRKFLAFYIQRFSMRALSLSGMDELQDLYEANYIEWCSRFGVNPKYLASVRPQVKSHLHRTREKLETLDPEALGAFLRIHGSEHDRKA